MLGWRCSEARSQLATRRKKATRRIKATSRRRKSEARSRRRCSSRTSRTRRDPRPRRWRSAISTATAATTSRLLTSYYFDAANDYMVHVFLQDADGSLKPRVKYPVGQRPSSIDIGDVNGDGRADVVVGIWQRRRHSIGVLLQNASGTLDPMVSYPTVELVSGEGRRLQRRWSDGRRRDQLRASTGTASTCCCRPRPGRWRRRSPTTLHTAAATSWTPATSTATAAPIWW